MNTKLWQPIQVGSIKLNHRLAMAPMTRSRSTAQGVPTDLNAEYYAQRASMALIALLPRPENSKSRFPDWLETLLVRSNSQGSFLRFATPDGWFASLVLKASQHGTSPRSFRMGRGRSTLPVALARITARSSRFCGGVSAYLFGRRLVRGCPCCGRFHRNEEIVREKIRVEIAKRGSVAQLVCGHPAIRIVPFPASDGITLDPFLQIRRGHRIGVNAHILGEKTCQGFKTPSFQIAIGIYERSDNK